MTEPMTAEEARERAVSNDLYIDHLPDTDHTNFSGVVSRLKNYSATLRAYADMLEREASVKVNREAIRIEVATCWDGLVSVDEATDRILSAIEGGE